MKNAIYVFLISLICSNKCLFWLIVSLDTTHRKSTFLFQEIGWASSPPLETLPINYGPLLCKSKVALQTSWYLSGQPAPGSEPWHLRKIFTIQVRELVPYRDLKNVDAHSETGVAEWSYSKYAQGFPVQVLSETKAKPIQPPPHPCTFLMDLFKLWDSSSFQP